MIAESWSVEDGSYRLKFEVNKEQLLDPALRKRLQSIWKYSYIGDRACFASGNARSAIEQMRKEGLIDIKGIPILVYKRFTIEDYDPLKDEELLELPEVYKQLDDLQPKHLTKQGSYYFIQNAWFQRLLSSLDIERDVLAQKLLFDNGSWFRGQSKTMKTKPFSLNIHHNKIISWSGRYSQFREEWIIPIDRFNEFKAFMSSRKPKPEIIEQTSTHQGCYLTQLNCDSGSDKYKIGKAKNIQTRIKSDTYRNCFIYMIMYVSDENECEKEIIREFDSHFTQVSHDTTGNYGRETYRGNVKEMMKLFYEICSKYI